MHGRTFMRLGCCAERYEQWILSEPLAFLWQVIAVTYASEPLLGLGKICVLYTVQCHNAVTSQAQPCLLYQTTLQDCLAPEVFTNTTVLHDCKRQLQ